MDPDSESPVSRIERTFWTLWYYVTGAVNRFLSPEPTNIVSNDPDSLQESAGNTSPEDNGHTQGDASRGELDEEQPLAAASLLKVSKTVVAWELCKTEESEDFKEDEECAEHETLMSGSSESKVSEEGESQTENHEAGQLRSKDTRAEKADQEENVHQKVQAESIEVVEYEEKLKAEPLSPTDDGEGEITEREIPRTMTRDDPKKMDEIIQLQEEVNKIHPEDEQVVEDKDEIEIKLCTIPDSSLEEEDNVHMDQAKMQRDDTTTALMLQEVESISGDLQLESEYENKSDDEEKPDSQISVCELWSDSDPGVKLDTGKDQMTAHRSESDKDEQEEENENMLHEREQCEEENISKAENKQMIDEEPEQENNINSIREDSQGKDILAKRVAFSIDDLQNAKPESKVSEEGESTREGQNSQTENDDAELLSPKDTRSEEAKEEENKHQEVDIQSQAESVEYKEKLKAEPLSPTDDGEGEITEREIPRTMTRDDPKKMDETIQLQEEVNKIHPEDEQVVEDKDEIEIKLCTIPDSSLEEEDNVHMDQAKMQRDDTTTALMLEEVESISGDLQLESEYENKSDDEEKPDSQISVCELWSDSDPGVKLDPGKDQMTAHRSESDKDEQEEENENMLHEREQCEEENMSKAENKQTIDEEPEQENDIRSIREDSQGKDILAKRVAFSIDDLQNAKPEVRTAEFTDVEEEEDVANNCEVQRKTRETDDVSAAVCVKSHVTAPDFSGYESFFDKDHAEEEKLFMETARTHTSNTLGPEAGTGLEINGEFKNISLRMCEGEVVVSQELNSPTCGETQEGVPEYNNELGLDENSTQRFLEVVDCKEIQTTQLPEEVGSQESETLQNSSHSTGADYSLVEEHRNREQENTDNNTTEHAGILHHTRPAEQVTEESGVLFDKEEGQILVLSMKTATEHSEKELETHVGLTDESDETTAEQHDGTVELLVEFETDEGFTDLRDDREHGSEMTGAVAAEKAIEFAEESAAFIDAEDQKMADTNFFQESVDTINLDEERLRAPSLLEGNTESESLKQPNETEPKTTADCTVDMHSALIDSEETAFGLEEGAARNEMQNDNLMEMFNLQLVSPLDETDKQESPLFTRSEVDEAFDISNDETVKDIKAGDEFMTDEFKQNDVAFIPAEEMAKHVMESESTHEKEESNSISGNEDVIDEEILDLWIQAASPEHTDGMKQQDGPQQIDVKIEKSNEDQAEVSVQAETGNETTESEFVDQSVCVWETQNSETQSHKSAATESFQDIYGTLASISDSTDVCDLPKQQFKSQDSLIEEAVRTGYSDLTEEESVTDTGFPPDFGVLSSEATQENVHKERVELVETETQKDTKAERNWKETEETDIKSPKRKVEEMTFEEEALAVTAAQTPDEFKLSRQSQSALELLSEEEIRTTKYDLQVDSRTESEKLFQLPSITKEPGWSAESLPEPNRAEVVEQVTAESEGLTEVDASTLNFTAQKSRIAVKNPRVRPPKDARSLLHMPSVEPTPSSHLPVKVPAGVPLGGLGVGIKLPGLGAGFPVLKKTRVGREGNNSETPPQEPKDTKPEDKSDPPKADEVQPKPKWMPPKQIGFGNPLMSELKTKLKKPTKE